METINPYYSPEKLGLRSISFDEGGLSYEYNTCLFVADEEGRVFMAMDSGCSCPTPFEAYEALTAKDATQSMTRICGFEDAWQQLRAWGKSYEGHAFVDDTDRHRLSEWFNSI